MSLLVIKSSISELMRSLAKLMRSLAELMRSTISELMRSLAELMRSLAELMRSTISELMRSLAELMRSTISDLMRFLAELMGFLSLWGRPTSRATDQLRFPRIIGPPGSRWAQAEVKLNLFAESTSDLTSMTAEMRSILEVGSDLYDF
ncbi:hypothetical protein Taro_052743 [Colocasia esculenta]|uniref:Uncharacterized protein n=1 Tax=Colocasia esculenta TaxID=4460 RepID=A0A843XKM1_COLES|nr:hypothetical protein [Colocasia esculenta]